MRRTLLLAFLLAASAASACSCFGPQTFCGTLNPQPPEFPEPEWWVPDAVILGVKLAEEDHGMDVEVVESIAGAPEAGDILRVWGDCGLLCRHYPGTWEIGDTVVWALKYTDLMGNGLCGTSLEQEGEYMISICGTYFLNYDNGIVTGPIAEGLEELPYEDLVQYIATCGATALPENNADREVEAFVQGGDLHVILKGSQTGRLLQLHDAQGRLVVSAIVQGDRSILPVAELAAGVHLLRIGDGRHSEVLRVLIP